MFCSINFWEIRGSNIYEQNLKPNYYAQLYRNRLMGTTSRFT